MNVEHLTIYIEPDGQYMVDEDYPDDPNGTRNPGHIGERLATPEEAGAYVTQWLRKGSNPGT